MTRSDSARPQARRRRQRVHFEQCDLTDIEALKAAIKAVRKALGPITILVNNAANDDRHTLEEITSEYFDDRIAREPQAPALLPSRPSSPT